MKTSQGWMEHYSSMERQSPKEKKERVLGPCIIPLSKKESSKKEEPKPVHISMKRRDMKILLAVREHLRSRVREAEQKKRALDIKEVDQAAHVLNPSSIEARIVKALSATGEPTHINNIIDHMETHGWVSSSKYHKYAQVYRAIRDNYYMIMKVGKATFRLRNGFTGQKPDRPAPQIKEEKEQKLTTLLDVIIDVASTYRGDHGIYPARVHLIMNTIGYNCAYSTVHRAMQGDMFERNGFWYTPKNDVHNSTEKS